MINFLSKHRYPNTAQDLWCLVGLLGNYATQTNKKGWVYELEFHRAVINEHKILTDTTERNNYLLLAIEQANYQLVLIGRLAQVPQITYSPTWRNWHQFLMNGTIPKLKMKLSQTK